MHPVPAPCSRRRCGRAAPGLGYASLVERNAYVLRRFTVPVLPDRPPAAAGAPPVSDLHLLPGQRRKAAWVASLADLRPDLVVNTGDNIAAPDAIPVALEAFSSASRASPASSSWGRTTTSPPSRRTRSLPHPQPAAGARHDAAAAHRGPRQGLRRPRLGRPDQPRATLDGAAVCGRRSSASTTRTSATTATAWSRARLPRRRPDASASPTRPTSGCSTRMPRDGAELVVAGHTHGGQLCVPGYGALVTNCDLDRGRAKGLSRWWPGAGRAARLAAPGGRRLARGVGRAGDLAVRAGPVRLPAGGDAADAGPDA